MFIEKSIENSPDSSPLNLLIPSISVIEWKFDLNENDCVKFGDLSTTAIMKMVSHHNKNNQYKLNAIEICKLAAELLNKNLKEETYMEFGSEVERFEGLNRFLNIFLSS